MAKSYGENRETNDLDGKGHNLTFNAFFEKIARQHEGLLPATLSRFAARAISEEHPKHQQ
jgi:hypothetical protein